MPVALHCRAMAWRLLLDGGLPGPRNMAVDEALAESVAAGASLPVVRLYRWAPPCLSLGASQPFEAVDAAFCAAEGIDIVRRPTGGRAVLHHLELTYLVAAPLGVPPFGRDLQGAYGHICQGLVCGLRRLGVAATVAGAGVGPMVRPQEAVPCFLGPAAGEVVVAGRKLVGSAMRRVGDSILQHGSVLLGWDARLQAGCLGASEPAKLAAAVITLAEILGAPPTPDALAAALVAGFGETFGVVLEPSALTAREVARAELLEAERYRHERWTRARDRSLGR